jgi:hypothetical protein
MFHRLGAKLSALFNPFGTIARELQIIRELYELELAARTDARGNPAPIHRVTESPGRRDTEVTFAGDEKDSRRESVQEVLANALDELED